MSKKTTKCIGVQVLIGNVCQCPNGYEKINNRCQKKKSCVGDQKLINGRCQCPATNQQLIGGYCKCPYSGQVVVTKRSQSGSYKICECPSGTALNGNKCVKNQGKRKGRKFMRLLFKDFN